MPCVIGGASTQMPIQTLALYTDKGEAYKHTLATITVATVLGAVITC